MKDPVRSTGKWRLERLQEHHLTLIKDFGPDGAASEDANEQTQNGHRSTPTNFLRGCGLSKDESGKFEDFVDPESARGCDCVIS